MTKNQKVAVIASVQAEGLDEINKENTEDDQLNLAISQKSQDFTQTLSQVLRSEQATETETGKKCLHLNSMKNIPSITLCLMMKKFPLSIWMRIPG